MTLLTEIQAARNELHKSIYWKAASIAKGGNHLWLTDQHLANALNLLQPKTAKKGISPGAGDAFTTLSATDLDRSLSTWKQLGAELIRFDVWGTDADLAKVRAIQQAGMEPVPIISLTSDPISYASRCATVAAWLGVSRYELGNEPNLALNKLGGVENWVKIHNAGYQAAHKANQNAQVSNGGLAAYGSYGSVSSDGNLMDMQLCFEKALAAGIQFDAVATHPYFYGDGWTLDKLTDRSQIWHGLGQTLDFSHSIKNTMAIYGIQKPIWLTENGVPTTGYGWAGGIDETTAASWLTWYLNAATADPSVQMVAIYSGRDRALQAGNREGHFGLLRSDWSAKPAANSL